MNIDRIALIALVFGAVAFGIGNQLHAQGVEKETYSISATGVGYHIGGQDLVGAWVITSKGKISYCSTQAGAAGSEPVSCKSGQVK